MKGRSLCGGCVINVDVYICGIVLALCLCRGIAGFCRQTLLKRPIFSILPQLDMLAYRPTPIMKLVTTANTGAGGLSWTLKLHQISQLLHRNTYINTMVGKTTLGSTLDTLDYTIDISHQLCAALMDLYKSIIHRFLCECF